MTTALAPASCAVDCAGARHHLVWRHGVLEAFDHPDPDRERALTALGGERYRCLDLLEVWDRYRDDLDVLVLGSRGPQDAIVTGRDRPAARHGRSGWYAYSSSSAMLSGGHTHRADPVGLRDVLRLGGGVPDRLSAEVINVWTARVERGDADGSQARLHAALYGRFAAAVRAWLGDPTLRVDVEVGEPGSGAAVERRDDVVRATLPFSWLADVWTPGLSVVADRLVLSATAQGPGRVELGTLDRGLTRRATVSIEIHEPPRG